MTAHHDLVREWIPEPEVRTATFADRTGEPDCNPEREARFLMRLAKTLHRFGIAAHRLEAALDHVADAIGLEARILVTPTFIIISVGDESAGRTHLTRVSSGALDLEDLTGLHRLVERVVSREIDLDEAERELERLREPTPPHGILGSAVVSGIAAGSAALLLEGGAAEAIVAVILGVVLGVMLTVGDRAERFHSILPLAAGLTMAFGAGVSSGVTPISTYIPALASLLVLLPGQALAVSMNELAHGHLISGGARLMGVLIVLLQTGFGYAIGSEAAQRLVGGPPAATPILAAGWVIALAVVLNMIAFGVRSHARIRDFPTLVVAAGIGLIASKIAAQSIGPELGVCVSAWAVGTLGNALSRWQNIPSQTAILPGILLLLPGSLGFSSMSSLMAHDVLAGIETAFSMILIAFSLVTGLLLANLTSRPKELF